MKKVTLKNPVYGEVTLEFGITFVNIIISGKSYTAMTKEIDANGYKSTSYINDIPADFNPIKLASAFIVLKDILKWQKLQTESINRLVSSYGLKHKIERLGIYQRITQDFGEKHTHLSNGEFIVAMKLLGFRTNKKILNVNFNLDKNYHYSLYTQE